MTHCAGPCRQHEFTRIRARLEIGRRLMRASPTDQLWLRIYLSELRRQRTLRQKSGAGEDATPNRSKDRAVCPCRAVRARLREATRLTRVVRSRTSSKSGWKDQEGVRK